MSNAMKYIRALEAAGFERVQAEAQVQMVLDAIEGDLVTKADFAIFKEQIENRFSHFEKYFENKFDSKFEYQEQKIRHLFERQEQRFDNKLIEAELRISTRMGVLFVSSLSVAVALLAWIIKL